jgi:alpha-tubulin suppressor-like RCC1 family protein
MTGIYIKTSSHRNQTFRRLVCVVAMAAGLCSAQSPGGTVRAWGNNFNGQLGNGTVAVSGTPVEVTGLSGAVAVAGGSLHSLALKSDGTVWVWGYNADGEVGNGSVTNTLHPSANEKRKGAPL